MKKTRAPDLTSERIQVVIDVLDGWNGKLTWVLLIAAVEKILGITYSRFTLSEYPEIANHFGLTKAVLRGRYDLQRVVPRDQAVRAALKQVDRLQATVDRLKHENMLLKEQFVTWANNAERKGVTIMMLNAPLAKPQRDQSKLKG